MPLKPDMEPSEKVAEMLRDREAADTYRRWYEDEKWIPALRQYFMYQDPYERKRAAARGRSSMMIAKAYEQVETKLPRWVETTFANEQIVVALPTAPDMETLCDQDTKLINFQMRRGHLPESSIVIFKEAILLGTSVVMTPWSDETVPLIQQMPLSEVFDRFGKLTKSQENTLRGAINAAFRASGQPSLDAKAPLPDFEAIRHIAQTATAPIRVPTTLWEGPVALHLDPFDVWFDPKTTSHTLENCGFVIRRFYRSTEELQAENKRREDKGLEPVYINLEEIGDTAAGSRWSTDSGQARRYNLLGQPVDNRDDTRHEILEFWYADGTVLALCDRNTLIRDGMSPFANPSLNTLFHLLVYEPQAFRVYGTGLAEWILDLLEGHKAQWNAVQDNISLVLDPPMVADMDRLVNPTDLTLGMRHGQLIQLDNMGNNTGLGGAFDVVKFPTDMVSSGWAQLDRSENEIEKTTGLYAGMKGGGMAPRTPYSLVASQNDEANVRIRLNLRLIGQFMESIANGFQWLNYQFLPPEYPITLFGENGKAYVEHVRSESIRHFFHYRFVGSSLEPLASRAAQQQMIIQLLNTLTGTLKYQPSLAGQLDWTAFLRAIVDKFDFLPGSKLIKDATPADQLAMLLQNPAVLQDPQVQQILAAVTQQLQQLQQGPPPIGAPQTPMQVAGGPGWPATTQTPGGQAPGQEMPPAGVESADAKQFQEAQFENYYMLRGAPAYVKPGDNPQIHLPVHAQAIDMVQQELQQTPDDKDMLAAYQALSQHIMFHQKQMQGAGTLAVGQGEQ